MEIGSRSGVRAKWLLFLLLFITGAAFGAQVAADEFQPNRTMEQVHPQKKGGTKSGSAEPGLTKVLTTKHPRRTDIPDAFLVIMLALIGVVVISRRGVTGKEGALPPKRIDE